MKLISGLEKSNKNLCLNYRMEINYPNEAEFFNYLNYGKEISDPFIFDLLFYSLYKTTKIAIPWEKFDELGMLQKIIIFLKAKWKKDEEG